MIVSSELNYIWVVLLSFVPIFICAALLRAKGATGLLAVVGVVAAAVLIFMNFESTRLAIAGIAAVLGLGMGGRLSDRREHQRLQRMHETERQRQQALMKSRSLNDSAL